jgi:hypothetical protein
MIEAKQAVQIAKQRAAEMLDGGQFNLEEIEREPYKGRDTGYITLSLSRPPRDVHEALSLGQLVTGVKDYKRFLIDAETGELIAMKIREVATQ